MSIEETVEWFGHQFDLNRKEGEAKTSFICGATSDIDSFRVSDGAPTIICYTKCSTNDIARTLILKLKEDGFSVAKEVLDDSEIYIFMYKTQS